MLAVVELSKALKAQAAAVNRVHSLYVAYKMSAASATGTLAELGVPADQQNYILQMWRYEREANVKHLTASQIANAVHYDLMTAADGQKELEALGYSAADAIVLIELRNHGPLETTPTTT